MDTKLKVSGIIKESIVDGPGLRYVIFTQGCFHKCEGCHNPHTHDMDGGYYVDISTILGEIKRNPLLDGVTFSGGEPFLQCKPLSLLGNEIKKLGLSIITYTGYTFEQLFELSQSDPDLFSLLKVSDIIIDGKFEIEQKDLLLKFKGSKNQRIVNVSKSLHKQEAVMQEF